VKDTIFAAQDNSEAETHYFATYEAIYDVVSTNGKLQKTESTILPASAILTFVDSLFTDGDGIEFTVDFGPLGTSEPKGVLCRDGRYRAGMMHIKANSKFLSPDFKVDVMISESDNYFNGNGSDMIQLVGLTTISKLTLTSLQIEIKDAELILPDYRLSWNSSRVVELVSDKGPGIWGDVYQISGTSTGVNRFNETYTVTTVEPLIKRMEVGCARTFVSGKLQVSVTNTNKVINIDYDPYGNGACDLFAEADIMGKKTVYRVK
jgi:hypothetical protein